ncbi:MAG: hypothetical protein UV35_C0026G0001 [candidate division WWE3 bacterium GW2011_GWB1_42_6]|uniref:Uncharacterized protein n=1 Tax=candidate division WWE3 bacterium GW2011_GWB1_42_6 TaxID=1619115 RepID=A0A0G1D5A9_UNCKA|nr:MAG: hypothetical protein UV35_C0026G0001 [candidate division WWE3 bacterium GW2011_GWB1_42_6]
MLIIFSEVGVISILTTISALNEAESVDSPSTPEKVAEEVEIKKRVGEMVIILVGVGAGDFVGVEVIVGFGVEVGDEETTTLVRIGVISWFEPEEKRRISDQSAYPDLESLVVCSPKLQVIFLVLSQKQLSQNSINSSSS